MCGLPESIFFERMPVMASRLSYGFLLDNPSPFAVRVGMGMRPMESDPIAVTPLPPLP